MGRFNHWRGLIEENLLLVVAIIIVSTVGLWFGLSDHSPEFRIALLWTLGSKWGFVTTLWTLRDTWLEFQSLKQAAQGNRVLTMIAAANVRREVLRVAKFAALALIGLSVVTGNSNPTVSRSLLLFVVALMIANSVLDRYERRTTNRILRRAVTRSEQEGGT